MNDLTRLLCDLVRLPSVNPMGLPPTPLCFEERVTDYLAEFCRAKQIPFRRQPVAPQRANLIAVVANPTRSRTVLFEVHQDTVPVDGMTIDPFAATIRDGRCYGRGSCDVKGSMAVMLSVLARLAHERPPTAANLVFAATVDEEHTFLGVQELVRSGEIRADAAIVAEPTRLGIVTAHKGVVRWEIRVPGRACHSSRPQDGINAVYRMARLVSAIERYNGFLEAQPADPLLGTMTISVGTIQGGVSVNTVPDRCVIQIDRRLLPGEDGRAAPRQLEEYLRTEGGIDFPFVSSEPRLCCPALTSHLSGRLTEELGAAIAGVVGSYRSFPVPFGTDASSIAEAGIPAVVFGPGDIAQAHTADEWIELAQMDAAAEILYRFVIMP